MPYVKFRNCIVYLHKSLYKEVRQKALRDKDIFFRSSSEIKNSKAYLEAQKIIHEYLFNEYKRNKEHFYTHYCKFDLREEKAREDTWSILYDYCHLYGSAYLKESGERDFQERLFSDLSGESINYPMGTNFYFCQIIDKYWFRLRKKPRRIIAFQIALKDVTRIAGSMNDFIIVMGNHCINFSKNGIKIDHGNNMSDTQTRVIENKKIIYDNNNEMKNDSID